MNLFETLQNMNEVIKEDDSYYQGAFWIIGNSMDDIINKNKFHLCCHKILSNYDGSMIDKIESKRSLSHERLWNSKYKVIENSDKPFNYYPRGRVGISNGIAYINIINDCDTTNIINHIIDEYKISKLEIKKELVNEFSDGGHRAHLLK